MRADRGGARRLGARGIKTCRCSAPVSQALCLSPFSPQAAGQANPGSQEPSDSVAPTVSLGPTTTASTNELVGRWEHVNECPQLMNALAERGLEKIATSVAGDYFPIRDPRRRPRSNRQCLYRCRLAVRDRRRSALSFAGHITCHEKGGASPPAQVQRRGLERCSQLSRPGLEACRLSRLVLGESRQRPPES